MAEYTDKRGMIESLSERVANSTASILHIAHDSPLDAIDLTQLMADIRHLIVDARTLGDVATMLRQKDRICALRTEAERVDGQDESDSCSDQGVALGTL